MAAILKAASKRFGFGGPKLGLGGIIVPIMDCPEREALLGRCTAAWEAYEAEDKKAGLRAGSPFPVPRSVSELIKVSFQLDPRSGPAFSQANSTAIFLRAVASIEFN